MSQIEIITAGIHSTIQDLGRFGFRRIGVPVSGAMDAFAYQAANVLVGNDVKAAEIEFAGAGLQVVCDKDAVVAVTGGGYGLVIAGRSYPGWMSIWVRAGEPIEVVKQEAGVWGYFAVAGGLRIDSVLGSCSTYLNSGFGGYLGRCIKDGDQIWVNIQNEVVKNGGGRFLPAASRPRYNQQANIHFISGMQSHLFSLQMKQLFQASHYVVSSVSSRMGYRMSGSEIYLDSRVEILSEGVVPGCIQIPSDGQPIVLLSDCQTMGGYPKIGCVISADLPVFSQLVPESGQALFQEINFEQAIAAIQQQRRWLLYDLEE